MKRSLLPLTLLCALAALAQQPASSWPLTRLHAAQNPLSSLPTSQVGIFARALKGQLDFGDFDRLRVSREDLTHRHPQTLYAVQGTGSSFCPGTGGCTLWIVAPTSRVLLQTTAATFAIDDGPSAFPDIVTSTPMLLTRWHYNGHDYRPLRCATLPLRATDRPAAQPPPPSAPRPTPCPSQP